MIEVMPRLYVGNQIDWETNVKHKGTGNPKPGWSVVQACKEPYHREALGYVCRGAPRDHAEYLWANRDKRLILNMVDVDDPSYIRPEMIDNALDFIQSALVGGCDKVLIHCNQGGSRAPGLALFYMHQREGIYPVGYEPAEHLFRDVYPNFQPAGGIRGYLIAHWDDPPNQV
jgi:hypothetical protein